MRLAEPVGERVPPHNLRAECSLLGALLLSRDAADQVVGMVSPRDFYSEVHQTIYSHVALMWSHGLPIDPVTLGESLDRDGELERIGGVGFLVGLQATTPATAAAPRYAEIIIEHSRAREVIRLAQQALGEAYALCDIGEIVDNLQQGINGIDATIAGDSRYAWDLDEFLARDPEELAPWLIPDLLRIHDRGVIVGPEGAGKTMLTHQVGVAAAYGIHPFTMKNMEPIRTMVIDGENNSRRLQSGLGFLVNRIKGLPNFELPKGRRVRGYSRMEGINLADRTSRADLEKEIANFRPDVIVGGPVYKFCRRAGEMNDEMIAMVVQETFDEWRARYDFALFLEHHASKGPQGGTRQWVPRGSALWMYWPEYGLTMAPRDELKTRFEVGRYREDRDEVAWPPFISKVKHGHGLPFEAHDRDAMPGWGWQPPTPPAMSNEPF